MNAKKAKAERSDNKKLYQHVRRKDKVVWDKLVDILFDMPFKARFGFAWRLIIKNKIVHNK